MDVRFITAGPEHFGSSRIRAFDVAEALRYLGARAEAAPLAAYQRQGALPAADAYVWQKAFDAKLMETAPAGAIHIWDACDPIWWFSPNEAREVISRVHAVTVATGALGRDLHLWNQVLQIPVVEWRDCVDAERYRPREHSAVDPIRLIWFGMSQNRIALAGAWALLERAARNGHRFSLTIFDDRPGTPLFFDATFPIYYARWELAKEAEVLASHDIALLPPYPGPWGQLKSDNKRQTATHAGLPVINGFSYPELESQLGHPGRRAYMAAQAKADYVRRTPADAARELRTIIQNLAL